MKRKHSLAIYIAAILVVLAIRYSIALVILIIDMDNVIADDHGFLAAAGLLFFLALGIMFELLWHLALTHAMLAAILPLSALRKYGKKIDSLCISISSIGGILTIALLVFRFVIIKYI